MRAALSVRFYSLDGALKGQETLYQLGELGWP